MNNRQVSLPDAAAELARLSEKPVPVGAYRRLYNAILNGELPAERHGGRWRVWINDAARVLAVDLDPRKAA